MAVQLFLTLLVYHKARVYGILCMEKLICAGMPRMKYKKEGRSLKLLVLDGNSIVNRAFYGIKMLTTKDGRYTLWAL